MCSEHAVTAARSACRAEHNGVQVIRVTSKAKIVGGPSAQLVEGDSSVVSYRVRVDELVSVVQVAIPTALIATYEQDRRAVGPTIAAAIVSSGRSVLEDAIARGRVPTRIHVKAGPHTAAVREPSADIRPRVRRRGADPREHLGWRPGRHSQA